MYSVPTHKHVIHFSAAPAHAQKNERPYDANLFRLAEFLGAIHYLRELCGANEKQLWRKQMEALVDAEGTTAIRKIKLVNNFNKGYRGYRRTYRKCTPPARAALKRFMQQGATLASSISKFGQ
ncbi:MAG: TIGR02301 family protein [Pseudomonadota bacterium]